MFNLDPGKLLVIAVVAVILLGPDRLPQVARQAGGAWRGFNEWRRRMESEVRSSIPDLPPTSEIARLARSPSALLNHLSSMSDSQDADGSDATDAADGSGAPDATGEGAATHRAEGALDAAATNGSEGTDDVPDGSFRPPVFSNGTAPDLTVPPRVPAEAVQPGDPTLN
jgi:sec-independent protein translocase protein TatB